METPLIKICGLTIAEQVQELDALVAISHLGFIFIERSPRALKRSPTSISLLKSEAVAVVQDAPDSILGKLYYEENFRTFQLHGKETPEEVKNILLSLTHVKVIKALKVKDSLPEEDAKKFIDAGATILLDGVSPGSGQPFNWELLKDLSFPAMIAGGIKPEDAPTLKALRAEQPNITGFDLNSGFESSPGIKDIKKVKRFIQEIA